MEFLIWGNTYEITLKPIFIDSYSSPLFKSLGIITFFDTALF